MENYKIAVSSLQGAGMQALCNPPCLEPVTQKDIYEGFFFQQIGKMIVSGLLRQA